MKTWGIPVILALAALTACSPVSVRYDYDRTAGFAAFHRFSWAAAVPGAPAAEPEGSLMDRRVRRIVTEEMAARGFQPETEGPGDFLLAWRPLYQDHYVQSFTALAPAWGWEYQPYTYGLAEVRRFQEGSLVLEVLDPGNRRVLWQAVAEGALTGLRDPQEADARVRLAVQRMLARFPPPGTRE